MISYRFLPFFTIFIICVQFFISDSFSQVSTAGSPFERKFGDVKFLDAYFGTADEKMEVSPGYDNVPFTIVFANIGSQDVTGIRGQLSLPLGFSASDGKGSLILANDDSTSIAGDVFTLTFFVNVDAQVEIRQYPGTVKVEYSRIRETGTRNAFFDFNFKVTGDSVINVRAVDPFLDSLKNNKFLVEIANDGTAPVSGVDIELINTQGTISSTSQSVTNVENVIVLNSNWDAGNIKPGTSKFLEFEVYVPGSLTSDTLRAPIDISYFNAHGDRKTISRIVDFYIRGLIDVTIYNVDVIDLSGKQTVIGEIINEGNENAQFGFVTLEPLQDSNIKKTTQFIDEIDTDSPVPFNIPLEFDGSPKYGEHDVKIIVRYKDSLREEYFVTHDATIFVKNFIIEDGNGSQWLTPLLILIGVVVIGFVVYRVRKRRKVNQLT